MNSNNGQTNILNACDVHHMQTIMDYFKHVITVITSPIISVFGQATLGLPLEFKEFVEERASRILIIYFKTAWKVIVNWRFQFHS